MSFYVHFLFITAAAHSVNLYIFKSRGDLTSHYATIKLADFDVCCKGKVRREQGCQMVSFQTKRPNLVIFWWALERKMLL
jgi:hypothetical protein